MSSFRSKESVLRFRVDFLAVEWLGDLRPVDLRVVDLRPEDLRVVDFLRVLLLRDELLFLRAIGF